MLLPISKLQWYDIAKSMVECELIFREIAIDRDRHIIDPLLAMSGEIQIQFRNQKET